MARFPRHRCVHACICACIIACLESLAKESPIVIASLHKQARQSTVFGCRALLIASRKLAMTLETLEVRLQSHSLICAVETAPPLVMLSVSKTSPHTTQCAHIQSLYNIKNRGTRATTSGTKAHFAPKVPKICGKISIDFLDKRAKRLYHTALEKGADSFLQRYIVI